MLAALAACTTRVSMDRRAVEDFYAAVAADVQAAAADLGPPERGRLADVLPGAERAPTWEAALDTLAVRPLLAPLAGRIRKAVDSEADDATLRLEIASPGGESRLHDLIVTTLDNSL